MIQNRLNNNGHIDDSYRLDFIKQKTTTEIKKEQATALNLFE